MEVYFGLCPQTGCEHIIWAFVPKQDMNIYAPETQAQDCFILIVLMFYTSNVCVCVCVCVCV